MQTEKTEKTQALHFYILYLRMSIDLINFYLKTLCQAKI